MAQPVSTEAEVAALVILAAVMVATIHLFAPQLHRLFRSETIARSVLAGLSAAYVFVILLPELDDSHEHVGDLIFAVVLVGFVLLYGIEHAAKRLDQATGDDRGQRGMYWVRTGMVGLTTFLFVLTVPDHLQDRPSHFTLMTGGAALGLIIHSWEVSEVEPLLHRRAGRWLLVGAAAAGAIVDLFVAPAPEVVLDLLTALLAGFMLLGAMLSTNLDPTRTRFTPFLIGTAVYLVIFVTGPLHPG